MNLILNLSPETEAMLLEQARAQGKAPEALALEALHDKLGEELVSPPDLPTNEWLLQFDGWVAGHKTRNPHLDDSRESIYPDRW